MMNKGKIFQYSKSEKFQIGQNTGKFSKSFFINVFPLHQKRFFFLKIMQAFSKKIKKTSYTLLRKTGKYCEKFLRGHNILPYLKLFGLRVLEYFSSIHQKRLRRLFIFFWKSLHYFQKKTLKKNIKTSYMLCFLVFFYKRLSTAYRKMV